MLERLPDLSTHTFELPSKKIHDGDDLSFFLASTAYRDLMTWLLQLNASMFPRTYSDGKIQDVRLNAQPLYSESVQSLKDLVAELSNLIEMAPPDTGPRRFGNVAFKKWYNLAEEGADQLLDRHLSSILEKILYQRRPDMQDRWQR